METLALYSISFLVLFPMLVALMLFFIRNDKVRSFITVIGALFIAVATIFCAIQFLPQTAQSSIGVTLSASVVQIITWVSLIIDVLLAIYIIAKGVYYKKYIAILLAIIQLVLVVWFELFIASGPEVATALYIDNLNIIMALIIGIIGSGICVYALGYMRVHEKHAATKDRRNIFFAIMFAFLGAMFAIVFSNNMTWMFCAWEITTVCSFALIGYTRTQDAINNSFRQITMNLAGGLAFAVALVWSVMFFGTLELSSFLTTAKNYASGSLQILTYLPLLCLAFAGFTKAAQMPFQSWLLGAMVAPTPTSALLHSSTMVKAGVFLLIKLSPCLGFNLCGYVVMLVGIVTFLFSALAAISQTNAKRVLAYSTISNLGLIIACAGIGTSGALWAAIFLLIFHAAAKSLLFLCVGTAEHHIGSRDIEDMDDLFERMPMLARFMAIGILGMFVAPFGMLISKWAAIEAFASSSNIVLLILLVFGSAATFAFWAKWLGKVLAIANSNQRNLELSVYRSEWASLGLMVVLTVGCCLAFPLLSNVIVEPYLEATFGGSGAAISSSNLWIMVIIALVLAIVILGFSASTKKRIMPVYMSGVGIEPQERSYLDSLGNKAIATQRNWYMEDFFSEKKVGLIGVVVSLVLLFGGFGYTLQAMADDDDVNIGVASFAVASYSQHDWEAIGVDFSTYLSSYMTIYQDYEKDKDSFETNYGAKDVDSYLDMVYEYYSAMSYTDASSEDSNNSDGNASDYSEDDDAAQSSGKSKQSNKGEE